LISISQTQTVAYVQPQAVFHDDRRNWCDWQGNESTTIWEDPADGHPDGSIRKSRFEYWITCCRGQRQSYLKYIALYRRESRFDSKQS